MPKHLVRKFCPKNKPTNGLEACLTVDMLVGEPVGREGEVQGLGDQPPLRAGETHRREQVQGPSLCLQCYYT